MTDCIHEHQVLMHQNLMASFPQSLVSRYKGRPIDALEIAEREELFHDCRPHFGAAV